MIYPISVAFLPHDEKRARKHRALALPGGSRACASPRARGPPAGRLGNDPERLGYLRQDVGGLQQLLFLMSRADDCPQTRLPLGPRPTPHSHPAPPTTTNLP